MTAHAGATFITLADTPEEKKNRNQNSHCVATCIHINFTFLASDLYFTLKILALNIPLYPPSVAHSHQGLV